MNDTRTGQLTSRWSIPPYAQGMLWLDTHGECVQAEGPNGIFQLSDEADALTLRWGGAEGPPLNQLRWQADNLEWDGEVRVGGFVTALHLTSLSDHDLAIAVIYAEAQALRYDFNPYPTIGQRRNVPYAEPDFFDGVYQEDSEGVTMWLAPDESPLVMMAHDAMLNDRRTHLFGRLANEVTGWHKHFALPVVLEAMTLFS